MQSPVAIFNEIVGQFIGRMEIVGDYGINLAVLVIKIKKDYGYVNTPRSSAYPGSYLPQYD